MSITELNPQLHKYKKPYTSPAATHAQQKIRKLRMKDEIKFLYVKKANLNSKGLKTSNS